MLPSKLILQSETENCHLWQGTLEANKPDGLRALA